MKVRAKELQRGAMEGRRGVRRGELPQRVGVIQRRFVIARRYSPVMASRARREMSALGSCLPSTAIRTTP